MLLLNRIFNKQYLLYCIFLVPLFYFSYINKTYQLDDALIYQRYVQNLFMGNGLVYNVGEFFNGLTSSLYTYLTIIMVFIIGDIQQASALLSTLFMALALSIFTLNFSKYEHLYFIILGALFAACFPYFYFNYGMETPLFLFLIGLCLYLFEKEDILFLGIACTLLIMTRSEGVFLILAMAVEHFRQKRPFPKLKYFIIPCLLLVAQYSFNKFYYGQFLPATASAKIQQGQSGYWGSWPTAFLDIKYQADWFFMASKPLLYSFLILPLLGIVSLKTKSINIVSILFLIFYSLFFTFLNIPNYHWYYAPYYIFMFFYSSIGIAYLVKKFKKSNITLFNILGVTATLLFSFWLLYSSIVASNLRVQGEKGPEIYRRVGQWLEKNTDPKAKIALVEIGTIGWYSKRYIIDILGLVNPSNAAYIGKKDVTSWLKHHSPDYILAHTPLIETEKGINTAIISGDFFFEKLIIPNFKLFFKNQEVSYDIMPYSISEPYDINNENNEAVLMVHAPGTVKFTIPAGEHVLTGKFGLLKHTYNNTSHPTDGVEFRAVLITSNNQKVTLFNRFLNPKSNAADRGIQKIPATVFTVESEAELILYTGAGKQGRTENDHAFWKKIQFK